MSDQSLAQLLKEARDFSDYQKVEARIHEQFISRDEAMGALLKLAARVEALESGQPEASPDPRPPTRPGDEFPTPGFGPRRPVLECSKCGDLPARTGLLNEVHGIGDPCPCRDLNSANYVACIGRLQKPSPEKEPTPTTPSKAVPLGSLAAGTWFTEEDTGRRRQVISTSTNFGDVWVSDTDDSHTLRNGDWLVIPDRPAPTPNPPSKAVRVDSLPVGAECWVKATVEERVHGRVLAFGINGALYFVHDALVLPAEPSAKEYNGGMATLLPWEIEARRIHAAEKPIAEPSGTAPIREVTIPRNDTGNSGSRTSPPAPIQLRVGHRYKRADDSEAECIRDNRNDIRCDTGNAFTCRDKSGVYLGYFANGRRWATISDKRDIVEDLGPVAERASNA